MQPSHGFLLTIQKRRLKTTQKDLILQICEPIIFHAYNLCHAKYNVFKKLGLQCCDMRSSFEEVRKLSLQSGNCTGCFLMLNRQPCFSLLSPNFHFLLPCIKNILVPSFIHVFHHAPELVNPHFVLYEDVCCKVP